MVLELLKEICKELTSNYQIIVYHKHKGICTAIQELWVSEANLPYYDTYYEAVLPLNSFSVSNFVSKLMATWPDGTGSRIYPIPIEADNKDVHLAEHAYDLFTNKWEGKQLELRLNLLDYMVEELDKLIEEGYQ